MPPQKKFGVIGRKWLPCPSIQQYQIEEIIQSCERCRGYFSLCCQHPNEVCHHCPLVFTDGSCLKNGKEDARAGCGVVVGTAEALSYSLPIEDDHVTSQRAELIGAYQGIVKGMKYFREGKPHPKAVAHEKRTELVIVTDSEYVVAGMTEWLEEPEDVVIGFWHVPRKYNVLADRLAESAAEGRLLASPF